MDDESGWHEILIDGWGPLVRSAVVERAVDAFAFRRGVLAETVANPDDAEAQWVEDVHTAIVEGIRTETGANIEELGSQAAWAPYTEVWQGLADRMLLDDDLVPVPEYRVGQVLALLQEMPDEAVVHAGGVPWPDGPVQAAVVDGRARVHLDGLFKWLATDQSAPESHRVLARALIAVVRGDPLSGVGGVGPPRV